MTVFLHLLAAAVATACIWLLSGLVVQATVSVAKRYNRPGFFVAFFILGLLTSIGEISVAVNATIEGVPQVSAGNLVGASFVIFLLIIPLLAIAGNGVKMNLTLPRGQLLLLLATVLLPALFLLDGRMNRYEGAILVLVFAVLVLAIQRRRTVSETVETAVADVEKELTQRRHATLFDFAGIITGSVLIFIAGKALVDEAVFFSTLLRVPPSFIGLLLLAIGTNIPELSIALRCVVTKRKTIALGDYMGSAATNTLVFGVMALANGSFTVEYSQFIPTAIFLAIGLALFYRFSQSESLLSRKEGAILLALYVLFLCAQAFNVVRITPMTPDAGTIHAAP